jgi:hypothetical protein
MVMHDYLLYMRKSRYYDIPVLLPTFHKLFASVLGQNLENEGVSKRCPKPSSGLRTGFSKFSQFSLRKLTEAKVSDEQ